MPSVTGFNKELLEAELFGYEGGAFTGTDCKGKLKSLRARLERMP